MSKSETRAEVGLAVDPVCERLERVEDERLVQELLDVLQDADCRAILAATSEEALSAKELSEVCRLPLSTTYRKVDLLADLGALAERTRLRASGKHTSEYERLIDSVVVSLDERDRTVLLVSMRATDR